MPTSAATTSSPWTSTPRSPSAPPASRQAGDNKYDVTGDLTIRGITKPVTVNFELNGSAVDPWGNFRVGFEGQATINRKDWGVNWNAALEAGGVMVSEKVNLEFEVEAVKVKPAGGLIGPYPSPVGTEPPCGPAALIGTVFGGPAGEKGRSFHDSAPGASEAALLRRAPRRRPASPPPSAWRARYRQAPRLYRRASSASRPAGRHPWRPVCFACGSPSPELLARPVLTSADKMASPPRATFGFPVVGTSVNVWTTSPSPVTSNVPRTASWRRCVIGFGSLQFPPTRPTPVTSPTLRSSAPGC